MRKIFPGVFVIFLFFFLLSSSFDLKPILDFLGTTIQFAATVVKSIFNLFLCIVEVLF